MSRNMYGVLLYSACVCGEGLPHTVFLHYSRLVAFLSPVWTHCSLLGRKVGLVGVVLSSFVFRHFFPSRWWLVVRHYSIVHCQLGNARFFQVVSSCVTGTDVVNPYTATSQVRFVGTSSNEETY